MTLVTRRESFAASSIEPGTGPVLAGNLESLVCRLESLRVGTDAGREPRGMPLRSAGILDALPGAVLILDSTGSIRNVNARARDLLGSKLIGLTWSAVVHRESLPHGPTDGLLHLRSGGRMHIARQSVGSADGEILMLTDVGDSQRIAESLQRELRLSAMGEMVAKLAHQIRTPLASALLYAREMARDKTRDRTPAGHICERLEDINRMIDEMLVFATGASPDVESFSVRDLFAEVAQIQASLGDSREPRIAMARDDLPVYGNRAAIKGAMLNLLDNAFQATGDDGRIELGAELTRDRVFLTVTDDGPGISPAIRDRLFEPFFTTRPQGTGLGLAIVRAVAESHGGDVIVDSSRHGTTVALCLPANGGKR